MKSRTVRVFVSSTFRDMQEERGILAKGIFPELRRRCRARGVNFVDVDLRWGVTEEQVERGETLLACLDEIDRCRPYFIALLGERYGHIPDRLSPETFERHPWLRMRTGDSLTAIEIHYGILQEPRQSHRAFVYLRRPSNAGSPDRSSELETSEAKTRLEHLKNLLRRSGSLIREYASPEEVGNAILEDLWSEIDREFPETLVASAVERMQMEDEAFIATHADAYVVRNEYVSHLDRYVKEGGPPLVILGPAGSGKSALIANWLTSSRAQHSDYFVLSHFAAASSRHGRSFAALSRFLTEINQRLGVSGELPDDIERLIDGFRERFEKLARQSPCILVIDGIDQIDSESTDPLLGSWMPQGYSADVAKILTAKILGPMWRYGLFKDFWLPEEFPKSARVILTGRQVPEVVLKSCQRLDIEPLEKPIRRDIIRDYFSRYGKKIDGRHIASIADHDPCSNPLFLRILLEEMRVTAAYKDVDIRIASFLGVRSADGFYSTILDRLEADIESECPGLIREILTLLWASRFGLSEVELIEMTKAPRLLWSLVHFALAESLPERGGLLTFSNQYLRNAVGSRYIRDPEDEHSARNHIAAYFSQIESGSRVADELPYQLLLNQEWEALGIVASRVRIIRELSGRDKIYCLNIYWAALQDKVDIERKSVSSFIDEYSRSELPPREIARACEDGIRVLNQLALRTSGTFVVQSFPPPWINIALNVYPALVPRLFEQGNLPEAERCLETLIEADRLGLSGSFFPIATYFDTLANLKAAQSDEIGAARARERARAIREAHHGSKGSDFNAEGVSPIAIPREMFSIPQWEELTRRRRVGYTLLTWGIIIAGLATLTWLLVRIL